MNGGMDPSKVSSRFEEPENIEWLMVQDYIPDFEVLNNQTISELPNDYRPVKPETEKKGWFFGLFGARK